MFCTAYRLQGNLRVVPLSIFLKAERDGASVRTPHPFLPVFENMVHNLTGGGNMLYFFSIKSTITVLFGTVRAEHIPLCSGKATYRICV